MRRVTVLLVATASAVVGLSGAAAAASKMFDASPALTVTSEGPAELPERLLSPPVVGRSECNAVPAPPAPSVSSAPPGSGATVITVKIPPMVTVRASAGGVEMMTNTGRAPCASDLVVVCTTDGSCHEASAAEQAHLFSLSGPAAGWEPGVWLPVS